jgi:Kef-type K+ transport system membrane component KefB
MVLTYLLPIGMALVLLTVGAAVEPESGGTHRSVVGGQALPEQAAQLVLAVGLIITCAKVFGALAATVRQPPVIGEIVAGILLGPSVLGAASGELFEWLYPADVRVVLDGLAQLGVIGLMFVVGREMRRVGLRAHRAVTVSVAQVSLTGSFLGGVVIAVVLPRQWAGDDASLATFAIFLGTALSVTALPVLARILSERGDSGSVIGQIAVRCAAISDLVAWCVIGVLTALSGAGSRSSAVLSVILLGSYATVLLWKGGPLLERVFGPLSRKWSRQLTVLALLACLLGSAAVTAALGGHLLVGALLFGAVCPALPAHADQEAERATTMGSACLLPFIFVGSGLRIDMWRSGLDPELLGVTAVVTGVAMLGKILGPALIARVSSFSWSAAGSLGVMLNARGLTELIVLNIGLQLGLISERMFVALVFMTLLTTAMTVPLLDLLARWRHREHLGAVSQVGVSV